MNRIIIYLETVDIGTVTVVEPTYCEGFYLVARADSGTINLAEHELMYGVSLMIEGTYQTQYDETATPFHLETNRAAGQILETQRDKQAVHIQVGADPATVAVVRSTATLFDEVDFAEMSDSDAAWRVLRNLTEDTRFEVISGSTH